MHNPFILTSLSIKEMIKEPPRKSFSKTLEDTIKVKRGLGTRYLRKDFLCIMPDSLQDWQSEAAQMGGVYKFAHRNFAANLSLLQLSLFDSTFHREYS
jgi:hypothetical protein